MLCIAAELAGFLRRFVLELPVLLPGVVGVVEVAEPLLSVLIASRPEVIIEPPSDGRPILDAEFGGLGKAPMVPILMVLRTVLSPADVAGLAPADFRVGMVGLEFACPVGTGIVLDGVLSFDGARAVEAARAEADGEGRLFLALLTGKAGKAAVGGSYGGCCNGLGRAVAIVNVLCSAADDLPASSNRECLLSRETAER